MPQELPNNSDFKKSGNFKRITKMFGIDWQVICRPPKRQTLTAVPPKLQKKCHKIFPRETYVTLFCEFVYITLSNIEHCQTVKPPNSRHLRVCANLSAIRRCSLLVDFVEIFKFWTLLALSSYAGIFWRNGEGI